MSPHGVTRPQYVDTKILKTAALMYPVISFVMPITVFLVAHIIHWNCIWTNDWYTALLHFEMLWNIFYLTQQIVTKSNMSVFRYGVLRYNMMNHLGKWPFCVAGAFTFPMLDINTIYIFILKQRWRRHFKLLFVEYKVSFSYIAYAMVVDGMSNKVISPLCSANSSRNRLFPSICFCFKRIIFGCILITENMQIYWDWCYWE